jgi:hypothetical protein
MLEAFKAMKVDVCLKMYYLHSLLNFFPWNYVAVNEKASLGKCSSTYIWYYRPLRLVSAILLFVIYQGRSRWQICMQITGKYIFL